MELQEFIEKKARVLVVDDVPSARKVVTRLLNKIGLTDVIEASTGDDALSKLQQDEVQLVISDWNMPEMDGLTLLNKMRENKINQIPFILITSSADRDEVIQAFKAGISDYIVKPFNGETLAKKVQSVIAKLSW
jgi:two-component system chemotaxis response regulator CheY